MGKSIYYYIVAAVLVLGFMMPQKGKRKKNYIILMAVLHTFVCGWRYKSLTGDLMKYEWGFTHNMDNTWFSKTIFNEGRNFGFFWLEKIVNNHISKDFQWVLIIIAIITEVTLAVLIFKYSPRPWLSYLMWNCVGFYVFGFSALKQALAMGLLMPAGDGLLSGKPKKFLVWTLLAGAIHAPALIFLPAYWITHSEFKGNWIIFSVSAVLIVIFRASVAKYLSQFYYDDGVLEGFAFNTDSNLGGRFLMMVFLLALGYFIKGLGSRRFRQLFKLVAVGAVLQSFSAFDNVYTRLADYYFQFIVLYTPILFYDEDSQQGAKSFFRLDSHMTRLAIIATICFSIWFYSFGCLQGPTYSIDDYTNYRFSWEVKSIDQRNNSSL